MTKPLFVLIAGPSGIGKTTVMEKLLKRGHKFHKVVTITTRPPRPGEQNGREYYFVSDQEFNQLIVQNKLLEHAKVFGNKYGVPADQVVDNLKAGKDVFLITDVQGAATIRAKISDVISIFLKPTTLAQINKRVVARETDSAAIQNRLREAKIEISRADEFTHVIVNRIGKLDETLEQIERLLDRHRQEKV